MSHSVTDSTVLLGHGSGGQMMKRIIDEVFLDAFGSPELLEGNDAGVAALPASGRIAMSTDSFVVSPQFFPGGNIGRLAVCGTVNDVATSGANVRYLSCGFILEEGYPMDKLRQIVQTMAETGARGGRVHNHGRHQGGRARRGRRRLYQYRRRGRGTRGRGAQRRRLPARRCHPGLGYTGRPRYRHHEPTRGPGVFEHHRKRCRAAQPPDCRRFGRSAGTRCFRDPTRGGLASTLNEFAQASGVAMEVDEDAVPVRPDVQAACEMLGYDVLQVANEGKMVAVVPAEQADAALAAMRAARYGENAAVIGRVLPLAEGTRPAVRVRTGWGSTRILDMLVGEQLPRIC